MYTLRFNSGNKDGHYYVTLGVESRGNWESRGKDSGELKWTLGSYSALWASGLLQNNPVLLSGGNPISSSIFQVYKRDLLIWKYQCLIL